MFRNQYDTDVTVWSPQGRLHQVEYAMEVVNQVSCGREGRRRNERGELYFAVQCVWSGSGAERDIHGWMK